MIHTILDEIKGKILDLQYVERYGGIVVPVSQDVEDEDGRSKRITFPASWDGQGKACYAANDYFELAPNDVYRSVSYWELRGDAVPFVPRRGDRGKWYGFRQSARLVVWLNLQVLGIPETGNKLSDHLSVLTMNALQGAHQVGVDYIDGVRMTVERKVRKSMDIFGAYSYSDRNELLLYPYDFFAIDFQVEWYIKRDCIPGEIPYKALRCAPIEVPGGGAWTPGPGEDECNCRWIDIPDRPHRLSDFENDGDGENPFITAEDIPDQVCSVQSYPTFAEFPDEPESCVLYIDESTKKQYIESGGAYLEVGSSENIYNTDGVLTGNRTVDLDRKSLIISGNQFDGNVSLGISSVGDIYFYVEGGSSQRTGYFINAFDREYYLFTGQNLTTAMSNEERFLKLLGTNGRVEYSKILSDDIDDSTSVNKFVTQGEKDAIANSTLNTDQDVSGNDWVLDEDNMASDSDTKVPTQQSVKAYVDANAGGNPVNLFTDDLTLTEDRTHDLDGHSFKITGDMDFSNSIMLQLTDGYEYRNLYVWPNQVGVDVATTDGKRSGFVARSNGPGDVSLQILTGQLFNALSSLDVYLKRVDVNGTVEYGQLEIPEYASDTDADNDANLASGAPYSLTGDRTVYRKP